MIASTDAAVSGGKNSLTTGTLTTRDLENKAEYSGSSLSLGGGYSTSGDNKGTSGVGKDQQGKATTGADQTPGSGLPSLDGLSATPPIALSASGEASSTTKSGISGGTITITDAAGQQKKTGQTAEDTVASLNRDVSSDKDGANALDKIFDEDEIRTRFEIAGAFAREAGTFLENRAKEADTKREEAKDLEARAKDGSNGLTDQQRIDLLKQAQNLYAEANTIADNWGAGGTYRQIVTAFTAGISGNLDAATSSMMQGMVVNYVQQQGASYIGDLVVKGVVKEGDPLHAALHAILACGGAAASNQSCSSGAMGAATSSLLTGLFSDTSPDETDSQREAKRNLILSLVTGVAAAAGGDAATANNAGTAAVDNNWLATIQEVQRDKELAAAETLLEQLQVIGKWGTIKARQDGITSVGILQGLTEGFGGDAKGVYEFLSAPLENLAVLEQLINSPEMQQKLSDDLRAKYTDQINSIKYSLYEGGDHEAFELGRNIGDLLWDVTTVVLAAEGAAKGTVSLAKAGVKVSDNAYASLSKGGAAGSGAGAGGAGTAATNLTSVGRFGTNIVAETKGVISTNTNLGKLIASGVDSTGKRATIANVDVASSLSDVERLANMDGFIPIIEAGKPTMYVKDGVRITLSGTSGSGPATAYVAIDGQKQVLKIRIY